MVNVWILSFITCFSLLMRLMVLHGIADCVCDRKSRAARAQSFAPRQQATTEFMSRNLSYYCLLTLHIQWCYSSRTSRSWWITQSTQRHRRGCNCCDRKSRAAYAQSFALRQQATIEFTCHDHSTIAYLRHIYVWCCSSRTSHSWWITQSTQHHRRSCNTAIALHSGRWKITETFIRNNCVKKISSENWGFPSKSPVLIWFSCLQNNINTWFFVKC